MSCNCKGSKEMNLKIKYFDNAKKLEINPKGDCIDVYSNKDVFVPHMGYALIPLGFALELLPGTCGRLIPRSSTFKTWGVIQPNSPAYIDQTYIGNDDQWHYPVQCTMPKDTIKTEIEGHSVTICGTWIRKGDKIAQFEIQNINPLPNFVVVDYLDNVNRNGFGSTGRK